MGDALSRQRLGAKTDIVLVSFAGYWFRYFSRTGASRAVDGDALGAIVFLIRGQFDREKA